jgi:5-methylcytosine-specific restriction endonuclease McrA
MANKNPEYSKKYYQEHAERLREDRRLKYLADADMRAKARARASAWYYANKAKAHKAMKAWAHKNPEKVRSYHEKVLAKNPERKAKYHCARRSRELASSPPDSEHLAALHRETRCYYCGIALLLVKNKPFNPQRLVIEHKTPVSRGGTNANDNLVAACARCNCRKHKKTEDEFFKYLRENY